MQRRRIAARLAVLLAAAVLALAPSPPAAGAPAAPPVPVAGGDAVARADGTVVVPDRFLRPWDPVTVFLDRDAGPEQGGPADDPGQFATIEPVQPGAWQWLGKRVLQFRPAEPWPPLRRVQVRVGDRTTALVPLLPTPVKTAPEDTQDGYANLDTISLTFPEPVDIAALARLMTIELRRLPGIDRAGAETLAPQDVRIERVERAARAEPQTYLVRLRQPVPDARLLVLRLRLSDEAGLDDPTFELRLRSAQPFRLTDTYCGGDYTHDTQDGVTRCTGNEDVETRTGRPELDLHFSEAVQPLDIMQARQALRLTPPVEGLDVGVSADGHDYQLRAPYRTDVLYRLDVAAGALTDRRGRPLAAAISQQFAFRADPPALRWDVQQGIAERYGPQMIPMRGHGYDRADLRVHRIDPLDRNFWPFPRDGVTTKDDAPPPLPGNDPPSWTGAEPIDADGIAARIKGLGSPASSRLAELPIRRDGADAKFGVDLKADLAGVAGEGQAGTYLVGLRPLQDGERRWLRLQVTDLALSAVEEPGQVRFAVTSLASARPVGGAEIWLEGTRPDARGAPSFAVLAQGVTDDDGFWRMPGRPMAGAVIRRVVAVKGNDTLVLDATTSPPRYEGESWSQPRAPWLDWLLARDAAARRIEKPRTLCHVFTERPIYRPEEAVEIRGFVRSYVAGGLDYAAGAGTLVVHGPNDQEWRIRQTLDDAGGFYQHFDAKTEATGDYSAQWVPDAGAAPSQQGKGEPCGGADFKKEAYRLPTFEVLLSPAASDGKSAVDDRVPLDAPFAVNLLARYYAGGAVSDRPVHWRVEQFPYAWTPPGRDGFLFSSDSRYSDSQEFRATPVLTRDGKTDAGGSVQLALDPTIEPTAQPRRYDVEATVTGDDDMQVRNVAHVVALPPFVLGIKVPRYLEKAGAIEPDLIAVDAAGKPLGGLAMTAKLIRRDWNAVLQASDFSQGAAKYATQQIDRVLEERHLTSTDAAQHLRFDAAEAGIYVVELTASDRAGRRQTVLVDLFVAGDTPVTWSRAPASTVTVTTDKAEYVPGETATLVIQSPFQSARALAVVEEPGGVFRTDWVDIQDGFGRYGVKVRKEETPRLAVHFLVMRGRLPGAAQAATAPFDQGKPTTVAATARITVKPVKNQVKVAFEAPETARPGQTIDLAVKLTDDAGQPIAGEATVWMVDQAILALATEAPLDPLPHFLVDRALRMVARDTRNMAFGVIPLQENPGGGGGGEEPEGMENISLRKNFTPVPLYLPRVKIGPDGVARLKVKLPDSLTVFMLRAEATSGPDRFGYGTGVLKVRQPVIAQPVLPRFLRPGDRFTAELLGRVVEGPMAGPGSAMIAAEGLDVQGDTTKSFSFDGQHPARLAFAAVVPEPKPGAEMARIRLAVRRQADGAGDAVQVDLPIRPDRPVVRQRLLLELAGGGSLSLAPPAEAVRPASYSASVSVASDPALVRSLGALDYLLAYPFGCTEQRIAIASAELSIKPFGGIFTGLGLDRRIAVDVGVAVRAIAQAVDEDGLVALFPQEKGRVWLTAYAYDLLLRVEKAGLAGDPKLRDRLAEVLTRSLRSDDPHLMPDAAAWTERSMALWALQEGGKLDSGYAAELARRANVTATDGLALVVAAIAAQKDASQALLPGLLDTMWSRVRIVARDGKPAFGGISDWGDDPLIVPSETRALANVLRAATIASPVDSRLPLLRAGLSGLGGAGGWGSTNADAAALRALATLWAAPAAPLAVKVTLPGDAEQAGTLDGGTPMLRWTTGTQGAIALRSDGASPLLALQETRYLPSGPGATAAPVQQGFSIARSRFRVAAQAGAPMEALAPGANNVVALKAGDVIEEVAEVVNPEDRTLVAIRVPLAAGLEPLNPRLATAPAEATPSAGPTLAPSYVAFTDDAALYVYDVLPKGTYQLRFRARAGTPGSFTEPPAEAEMMYRDTVYGASAGARVDVAP